MNPPAVEAMPPLSASWASTPLGQLRRLLRDLLRPVAGAGAGLEADLLLMTVMETGRARLLIGDHRLLTSAQVTRLIVLAQRRMSGEPMAYILGRREFWSLSLKVTEATLIPRPETELLVEIALNAVGPPAAKVADLGTGSGAIALALASECPEWRLVATDSSAAALKVATDNARQLGIDNIEFRLNKAGDKVGSESGSDQGFDQGDSWLGALAGERFDLIVSNPPYVAAGDPCLRNGDTAFEPRGALAAGADGLDDLKSLIAGAADRLF